jgi:hypothetical protein
MNIAQKYLSIITLSLLAGCKYDGFYVFGDSNSSLSCAWPDVIADWSDFGAPTIQKLAVPAMAVSDLEVPSWLKKTSQIDSILLYMGGNDAGFFGPEPPPEFEESMSNLKDLALEKNLNLVCIEIPKLEHLKNYNPEKYIEIQNSYCDDVLVVEPNLIDSPDKLHMTCQQHINFAARVLEQIDDNIKKAEMG